MSRTQLSGPALAVALALAGACSPRGGGDTPFRSDLLAAGLCLDGGRSVAGAPPCRSEAPIDFVRASRLERRIEQRWRIEPARYERDLAFVRAARGDLDSAIGLLGDSPTCHSDPGCRDELASYLMLTGERTDDPIPLLRALALVEGLPTGSGDAPNANGPAPNRDEVLRTLGLARSAEAPAGALPSTPSGWERLARRLRGSPPAEPRLLDRIAEEAPQFARQLGCEVLLADAAELLIAGRDDEARSLLAVASGLGSRLRDRGGDGTLAAAAQEVLGRSGKEIPRGTSADLLEAIVGYGKARTAIREERYAEADAWLAASRPVLARAGSVLAPWADHAAAVARRFSTGETESGEFERLRTVDAGGSPALAAHATWSLAVLADLAGDHAHSAALFTDAITRFEELGEHENVAVLRSFRAFTLFDLGRDGDAATDLLEAARLRPWVTSFDSLEIVVDTWLALLVTPRFPGLAWRFQDELVAAARESGRPSMLTQALLVRGENGETATTERLRFLDEALRESARIAEPRERRRKEALIGVARAKILLETDPAESLRALETAFAFYTDPQFEHLLLETLVIRARALLRLGDRGAALRAHQEGVERVESSLRRSANFRDRHRALREARTLFEGLALLELERPGGDAGALSIVRRARGLSLAGTEPSPRTTRGFPKPGAPVRANSILVEFAILGGRTYAWTTHGGQTEFRELGIDGARLGRLAAEFERALRSDDAERSEALASELGTTLLPSLAGLPPESLRIVPDPALANLAWGALEDPVLGGPIGANRELALLAAYQPGRAELGASPAGSRRSEIRLIGAPRANANGAPLAELGAVPSEIEQIRAIYPEATVHLGSDATPAALLRRPPPRILHIAAHALPGAGPEDPPRLALAPDPEHPSGLLDSFEIAEQDLSGVELVLLPACGTSRGLHNPTEAPLSLAAAFLAAGARAVVATHWPVEDSAAASLIVRLHRRIAETAEPAEALRSTILDGIGKAPDRPSIWASFQTWTTASERRDIKEDP